MFNSEMSAETKADKLFEAGVYFVSDVIVLQMQRKLQFTVFLCSMKERHYANLSYL
jgi:hypothetical protein